MENKISNAELILNADGSVYHLGLQPDQVASLVFTVGDPDRVPKVSRYFDVVEHRVQRREFVTHTGRIGAQRVSVISTGIGTDNIDIVLNELDALFNVDFEQRIPRSVLQSIDIVRLGTTGGLQEDLPTDSFVASAGAFGMDGLLHFYQHSSVEDLPIVQALRQHAAVGWDFPIRPYYAAANESLLQKIGPDFVKGYTCTASGFYGPQGRSLRLPLRSAKYIDLLQTFDYQGYKMLNLEMETAGIYALAQALGHRALSLSVILANRAKGTFSQNPERATEHLIETVLSELIG